MVGCLLIKACRLSNGRLRHACSVLNPGRVRLRLLRPPLLDIRVFLPLPCLVHAGMPPAGAACSAVQVLCALRYFKLHLPTFSAGWDQHSTLAAPHYGG